MSIIGHHSQQQILYNIMICTWIKQCGKISTSYRTLELEDISAIFETTFGCFADKYEIYQEMGQQGKDGTLNEKRIYGDKANNHREGDDAHNCSKQKTIKKYQQTAPYPEKQSYQHTTQTHNTESIFIKRIHQKMCINITKPYKLLQRQWDDTLMKDNSYIENQALQLLNLLNTNSNIKQKYNIYKNQLEQSKTDKDNVYTSKTNKKYLIADQNDRKQFYKRNDLGWNAPRKQKIHQQVFPLQKQSPIHKKLLSVKTHVKVGKS